MRTSHVTVAIVALATIIISLLIMCGVPADPFDKSKTKVSLVLKSSDGQQSQVAITDTIGATDSIIVSIDLAQHFDSIIVTVELNSVKVDSFKFDDTTSIYATAAYGVKFLKAGNYQVNVIGYVDGLPNREIHGQISIVDRTEENRAPGISIRGRHVVTAGNRAVLIVTGTDPNPGQTATVVASRHPDGATFNADTFSWVTTLADVGTHTVVFIASDNGNPVMSVRDSIAITVTATAVNEPPAWSSDTIALYGRPGTLTSLSFGNDCNDADGDSIEYLLVTGLPEGDAISGAKWSYTPGAGDVGIYYPKIVATDPSGEADTLIIELTIATEDLKSPAMKLIAPALDSQTISASSFTVKISCVDQSGVKEVTCSMGSTTFDITTSSDTMYSATVTGLESGFNTIQFIATDKSPAANQETLFVTLNYDADAPDNVAPTITLVAPSKDTLIGQDSCEISVRCVDESGIAEVTIGGVTASREDDDIFTATVKELAGGKNTITIVATDSAATPNVDSTSVEVEYDNDAKGPEVTFLTPDKDSVTTNSTGYTILLRATDESGVLSVRGTLGTNSFTGARDTGKVWKLSITGLVANEVNSIILTVIDSSLHVNKTLDTVYITSEIINGHTVTFIKNDVAATGTMEPQTMSSGVETALSANAFTKDGWTFTGWATSASGEVEFEDGAAFTIDASDVKLYAVWSASDNMPPTITLVSPSKDTTIGVDSCKISVRCTDESGVALVKVGTVTAAREAGAVFSATVKGFVSGSNTITIVATDSAATPHTDSTQVKITYDNDVAGPAITKVTPVKDSVATNSANYTVSLTCTDPSGVKSVTGAIGTTKFTGTRGSGSAWDIAVSGLAVGIYTQVVFTATDSSLRANATPLTLYIKHDPTIGDGEGPTIKQITGPASGSVVSNPLVTIIDSITDPSNVDSVYWTLNNGAAKLMTPVAGKAGQYSLTETLVREKLDTIVVTAVDKSTQRNPSTQTIVLNYIIAPSITVQPASKEICSGGDATVSVTASGTAPLTYQWKNGTGNIVGATAATYTLSSVTATTTLTCVVSNGAATSATSNPCTITVNTPPTITGPTNQTTCSGTNATVSVTAPGATGYQWYRGAVGSGTIITGATSASHATSTAGSYYCVVTGSGCSANSGAATVTVNTPPTITGPTNQTTCAGTNATVSVTAPGATGYQWYRGAVGSGTIITGATSASYATSTAGSYYCVVTGSGCSANSSAATVTVNTPPTITGPTNQTTCAGTNATVSVTAPGATGYQWYRGAVGSGTIITGATSASYATSTAGSYYCEVTGSGCSANSSAATVTVNTPPSISGPTNQTTCPGTNATVSVTAPGATGYQWYRGAVGSGTIITGATSASYATSTAGSYYCEVTGSGCSTNSGAATITVSELPTITVQPSSATICPGNSASLQVVAAGATGYQWYSGNPGSGTQISGASLSSLSRSAAGSYYCVVSNSTGCSVNSTAAIVTLSQAPSITISGGGHICYGTSTIFSVSGSVNQFQWYGPSGIISNAQSSTYSTSTPGTYYCSCRSSAGCWYNSSTAELIIDQIAISPLPSSITRCIGQSVELPVTTTCDGGSYEWYVTSEIGTNKVTNDGMFYTILADGTLTFPFANAGIYEGYYYCVATDWYGNTATSNSCSVTEKTSGCP